MYQEACRLKFCFLPRILLKCRNNSYHFPIRHYWSSFITWTESVYCAVRAETSEIIQVNISENGYGASRRKK